ncbi:hypothetical protein Dimus_014107 [Dionaea muscipula]
MGGTADSNNNPRDMAVGAGGRGGLPRRSSGHSSEEAHGGTQSRPVRASIRVGESEVSIDVPSPVGTPKSMAVEAASGGVLHEQKNSFGNNKLATAAGDGASSSQESFVVECQGEGSGTGTANGNAGKKPAWNKPSSGNTESGPVVMGAESWPLLSESTKASPKLSFSDPSKIPPELSVSLSPVSGNVSSPTQLPASPQKHVTGNANPNQNHGRPSRQKSMKREGGESGLANGGYSHPQSPHGSVGEGSHNSSSAKNGGGGGVDGASKDRDHAHNNANRETGQRNSGDHPQQRNSYRRGNGGPHSRGDYSYQNYGGRRDQDRGNNPDWNQQRNLNGYVQPQRPFQRGVRPPPLHVPAPVIPTAPFNRPFNGVIPPEYQHVIYVPSPVLPQFVGPIPPTFIPPIPPQDSKLPEKIMHQIDYYFSNENLVKDIYLRKQMDEHGWVPITLIAEFRKVSLFYYLYMHDD